MPTTKLVLFMAFGVTLAAAQSAPSDNPRNNKPLHNNSTCMTSHCVLTASSFLSDMSPSADPCQDFSKFTCGGFVGKQKILTGGYYIDAVWIQRYNNERILHSIIDPSLGKSPKAEPDDVAAQNNIRKMHNLFSSCMDEQAILTAGYRPLAHEIAKIFSILPSSDSPANNTALAKTLALAAKYDFQYPGFIDLRVDAHPENRSANALYVRENGFGLRTAEDYLNETLSQRYMEIIGAMFQYILGEENVTASIKTEWYIIAKQVVLFEHQLWGIRTPTNDLQDPAKNYNLRSVKELSALTPSIDWPLLLQNIFPAGFNDTRPLIVPSPTYLTKLDAILQKTPAKTLQCYFSWLYIRNLAKHLSPPYRIPLASLKNIATTVSTDMTIEDVSTCLAAVNTNLAHIVTHYFVQRTFKYQGRGEVMTILDDVIAGYEKIFKTTAWVDQESRDGALVKLRNIATSVGYSTSSPNDTSSKSLNDFYRDYIVVADDYFANQIKHSLWSATRTFAKLSLSFDRESMDGPPGDVYGSYVSAENSIKFRAGILQMPFFHVENPEYINYSGIGAYGSQIIGAGFDNTGREFSPASREVNWWSNATARAFEEKSRCFVEQYGNFTVEGSGNANLSVDGRRTLRENIAENGGVKMAFQAWKKRFDNDPNGTTYKNFQLPGLEKYTRKQLFFISYSRQMCINETPVFAEIVVQKSARSPAKWRINGVAQNSPEFAEAFNCPFGSPMNPVKKCAVW